MQIVDLHSVFHCFIAKFIRSTIGNSAFDAAPRARLVDIPTPILGMDTMAAFIAEDDVKMAILTVPVTSAQEVANALIESGVQAILNFSPTIIDVPDHVVVNSVDLAVELENLSYFIR